MLVCIFSTLFLIFFIGNSSSAIPQTAEALRLFLFVVLPSIFPLCVLSNWMIRTGAFQRIGQTISPLSRLLFGVSGMSALAILIGWIGSYPNGAKTTASLYKNRQIPYKDAVALTAFTNNAGPLFVIGVIGTAMLSSTQLGIILWGCHLTASLLIGIWFGRKMKNKDATLNQSAERIIAPVSSVKDALKSLTSSISDAAQTMLPVGGTVIFFAALCASIEYSGHPFVEHVSGILSMLAEMTSGCQAASQLQISGISESMQQILQCCLYSGIISWGGISVHLQVIYILSQHKLPCRKYLVGKILHTFLSMVLTFCAIWIYQRI